MNTDTVKHLLIIAVVATGIFLLQEYALQHVKSVV